MRSLRNRLALLVFVIVLGAIAIVYLGVIPSLESSLRDEALRDLRISAQRFSPPIGRAIDRSEPAGRIDDLVRDAADRSSARVTLLGVNRTGPDTFLKSDSTREVEIRDLQFGVAVDTATSGRAAVATEAGAQGRVGEAALPLFSRDPKGRRVVGSVVVFSRPLSEVSDTVAVIRRRILVAGAVALLVAAMAGWLVARAIAYRVRRLEVVADRVAQGDLTARFPVDSSDELGHLARALEDMRRQLEELDTARKRFIATASHELRTPLFSLGGFLELLEDEDVDEEDRRRFLAQLRAQVARMQKLATDLLDLSRLEAGSLDLRAEETDLGTLARAVASEFTPALSSHDAHLELRLPPEPVNAVCDPERVAQVMRILIDNAITHTPPGTDVVVTASRRDGSVRLGVGDFGPGIHRTMLPRIFEPFVTTDDAQGSGLGLAIAHELAERMAGRLAVDSQPGRTTFTLELPV
jgi:two-component system, OmpR family, sensor kinase